MAGNPTYRVVQQYTDRPSEFVLVQYVSHEMASREEAEAYIRRYGWEDTDSSQFFVIEVPPKKVKDVR